MNRYQKSKKSKLNTFVEPDEIFLDSANLPDFNKQQFEGRIEKPISKKTMIVSGLFFLLIALVFSARIGFLQITKGQAYSDLAEKNSLDEQFIFSDRGIIYDRNKVPLAFNTKSEEGDPFFHRSYIHEAGFGHLLGYVGYPAKDKSGYYWQNEFIGKDGLEKMYNDRLSGKNGLKIFETDVRGTVQSENIIEPPVSGDTLTLSIDSQVQAKMYEFIKSFAENYKFEGGVGMIMDVTNGEILAITSYPEYDPEILSSGSDQDKIKGYLTDKRKPFLNRGVQGLYTPGSIVKPVMALAALNENVIDPIKKILSIGYISIPNPYFPDKKTIFKDWKAHGWINMKEAIAQSSDVYFYEIGGGFEDQKGLGIANIDKYSKIFGIGEKTGIDLPGENAGTVPTPAWKEIHFPGNPWRVGDTYNTVIGQYGYQTTPIGMLQVIGAIANYGKLMKPHVFADPAVPSYEVRQIDIPKEYFDVVHDGMKMSVSIGTASRLNLPFVKVSAKTGTAQLGAHNERVNSWVVGFFPSDAPHYAFTVMMENGPSTNAVSSSLIMNQLLSWMNENTPDYLK